MRANRYEGGKGLADHADHAHHAYDDEPPLTGVRVLEIAGGVAAGFATHLLGGFGADVVRVEGHEDQPPLTDTEEAYLVAGKRRVRAADLGALARAADIVIEEGTPGRLDDLGLAPAELRADRPALVVVSISPFGQTGPYRRYQATNIVSFATGGIMSLTGSLEKAPLVTGGSQAQYLGGLHAHAAAATAYLGAVVGGEGDWIDLSLQECAAGLLELYAPWVAYGSPVLPRMGNQTRGEWGIYPCLDGYVGIFALQRQVRPLFEVMAADTGDPELLEGPLLDSVYRLEHNEEVMAKVLVFTLSHTQDELMAIGRARKIPVGLALTPAQLLASPTLAERDPWDDIDTPAGTARVPGRPFGGLGWRPPERLHAPGEDTDAVAQDWLAGAQS